MEEFLRTKALIGEKKLNILKNSRIAIFGLGGVGSYVVEALARCGIGTLDIIDNDTVNITNINRQIIATHKTLNKPKVEVEKQRILDINQNAIVNTYNIFYNADTSHIFDFSNYNYVVDAIDSVSGKIELVMQANNTNTPIIASMGTGNKLNPLLFEVSDIYKTSVCPLARVMRKELKNRGIKSLKVVYSKEIPIKQHNNNNTPASVSFVPSVAGLIIAGEVVNDLIKKL